MPWIDVEEPDEISERERQQVLKYVRRKAKARFYADENFPEIAIAILRQRKADVLTVRERGKTGHPDENHAAEALRLRRVLITCDRDYLDEHRFPLISCPALVVCDFGRGTIDEIRDTLRCLGGVFSAPQFFDKWTKIDAGREGWTEYSRYLDGTTSRSRQRIHSGCLQEWVSNSGP
jgi:hypothetical protein